MAEHLRYDGTYNVIAETESDRHYPIRPEDLNAGEPGGMLSTFGKAEVEEAAERLVLFFKKKGYWGGFRIEELEKFYRDSEKGWDRGTAFFGLMGAWWDDALFHGGWREPADVFIAVDRSGNHYVTDRFVLRCAKAADPTSFLRVVDAISEYIHDVQTEDVARKKLS